MYSVSFIFETHKLDEEFQALDSKIEEVAQATEGFLGKESWKLVNGETLNTTYYWATKQTLNTFSKNQQHIIAKRNYKKWYKGFQIIISKVEKSYGDGGLSLKSGMKSHHENVDLRI